MLRARARVLCVHNARHALPAIYAVAITSRIISIIEFAFEKCSVCSDRVRVCYVARNAPHAVAVWTVAGRIVRRVRI